MNLYIQYVLSFFAIAMMSGVAFAQFRKGFRIESGDIVTFYKTQAENYKEMMEETRKDYTKKHEELLAEVGVLRGELNTEKRLREQYELILKDKNPETEEFMKLMIKAVADQGEVNKEVVSVLKEIHTMSKAEHDRDFKVETTVTKT